jgi:hypothetical protein
MCHHSLYKSVVKVNIRHHPIFCRRGGVYSLAQEAKLKKIYVHHGLKEVAKQKMQLLQPSSQQGFTSVKTAMGRELEPPLVLINQSVSRLP